MNRRGVIFLVLWISSFWSIAIAQGVDDLNPALLEDSIALVSGQDVLYLNETSEVQLDAESAWARRQQFKIYGNTAIDFGYLADPVWVIFKVKNDSSMSQLGTISLGRPELMIAEIYLMSEGGPEQLLATASGEEYAQRFRNYLALAETTEFVPGETKTVLVRIQSSHSSALPLAIGYQDAFKSSTNRQLSIVYVFTAIALTVILLNVTLMMLIGYRRLLWFPLSQIFAVAAGWQLNRYPYLFIDPPGREIARFVDQALMLGAILLLVQFGRVFFRTSENMPRTDQFAIALQLLGAGFLTLEFMGLVTEYYAPGFFVVPTTLIWLVCFATLVWIAISARLNGMAGAGWILAAWMIYGGIITYMVVESLTVLPPLPYQSHIMVPLVALEATIVTHALGLFGRRNMQRRVSAQQELATSMRREIIALQDLASRSRLLLAMGHDGRNLLGGLNYLSSGIRDAETLQDAKDHAARLQDVSTMLDDMLNIMVDNAASGQGAQGPIALEPVKVERLLTTVRIVAGKVASRKGISVRIRSGVDEVITDNLRVFRILTNLVSNAGKYSDQGKILLTCRRRGAEMRFQVFDQGSGLTEDEVSSLLEFRPVRFDTSEPGEGVGLTICQEFASDLGGELRISSQKGRGSLFELCLPVGALTSSEHKYRVGVLGMQSEQARLKRHLEIIELEPMESVNANKVDAVLLHDRDCNASDSFANGVPVLVATFEKSSEIRARWAGKAFAFLYSPITAEAVIAALSSAGKKPAKRILGAESDDADTDRRRSRPDIGRSDVNAKPHNG